MRKLNFTKNAVNSNSKTKAVSLNKIKKILSPLIFYIKR